MDDRIIQLLKHGIPPSAVARAVGVDPSYISQLMSDEGIRTEVAEARVGDVEKGVTVDKYITDLEEAALERLNGLVPYCSKPAELLRIFEVMNGAKKRTSEVTGLNQNSTAPLVQINISQQAAVALRISQDNQVIEIDGRSMATLPGKTLVRQLAERREAMPLISDAKTAGELLNRIEEGIPADSMAHVL